MTDELPPGWAPVQLREVVEILDNKRVPINNAERTKRLSSSTKRFPYYGATGQVGEIDDFIFEGEAILLGEDGAPFFDATRSKAYIVDGRYWVNNHAHILRGKDGVSNRFLCHQLNRIDYRSYVAGTTRLKLTQGAMSDIQLVLAPSHEQERIASKIDELFSRIDEGERALERVSMLVERYRQSVLKAAVTGELTRAWRKKNKDALESGEALLARILTARRGAWENAELEKMKTKGITPANDKWKQKYEEPASPDTMDLPELPIGWAWASLDMLAGVVGGITVDQKRSIEECEAVPYLRVANVQRGYLNLSEVKWISAPRDRIEQLRLQPGDILFNEGGDIDKLGRGWIWEGQLPSCIHQNHVFRARLFVAYALNKIISWYGNVLGRTLFIRLGKQTTNLASLSLSKLKSFPVPVMCPREADEIVSRVDDILSVTDHQASEIEMQMRGSSSLRQGVLKSAFSGRLVNQDPADEPASTLLERVAAERGTDIVAPKRGRKKKITA